MTFMEKWDFYCKEISSPQIFIEWAAYGIIAAALQRRVWTGTERKPLFPNLYIILSGPPGVGKGLILSEVKKVLTHFKIEAPKEENPNKNANLLFATKPAPSAPDLLIPVGADASTYEALVKAMSRCIRSFKQPTSKIPYVHSSICFCLEEISSLFRKHTEDLVNFLLVAYDCGDYRYETIGRGTDYIKNCCLNFMGGTTPSFIRRVFGDELLTDGFASRTVFAHALSNRFWRLRPPEFSDEQIRAHDQILEHVKQVALLHGEVKFTPDAIEFLEHWWNNDAQHKRANNSPKLLPYYARKNITVQKLAMVVHFMNHLTMEVNIDECKEAIAITERAERQMHFAVQLEAGNPLSKVTIDIERFVAKNHEQGLRKQDLLLEFWGELPQGENSLDSVLAFLISTGKLELRKPLIVYVGKDKI
jgi:hypothetical protein